MSISSYNDTLARGGLFGRLAHWRTSLAEKRRATREFAALDAFNDRALRDIGLCRETDSGGHRRHLMRF